MNPAKFVRKLKLTDKSVLLIKKESWAEEHIKDIGAALEKLDVNVVVMVVDDLDNIRALPQIEMQRYGWYNITKKILRKKEENSDDESSQPEQKEQ